MNSRNGTVLNGVATVREVLRVGGVLRVGNTVLRFVTTDKVATGSSCDEGSPLIGRSEALRTSIEHLTRAAPSAIWVLLLGETGTGKALAARLLHDSSGRTGSFRVVNCAVISRESIADEFDSASGGTVFLDEIGELSLEQQARLLRVLDAPRLLPLGGSADVIVDARVVAASNQDLQAKVAAGEFRADLYARLAGWVVRLAPLRDRPDDVYALLDYFFRDESNAQFRIHGDFFEPTPEELRRLAEELRGNVKAMAEFAGNGREQIYRWLRRYDIDPDTYRRR